MTAEVRKFFFSAAQTELGPETVSAELRHVARRSVNAAGVAFSFGVMILAPFVLDPGNPDLNAFFYLLELSGDTSLAAAVGGAAFGLFELLQRSLHKTA